MAEVACSAQGQQETAERLAEVVTASVAVQAETVALAVAAVASVELVLVLVAH